MQQTQAGREPRRRIHGEVKPCHHAGEDIHGQRQPGAADSFARLLIDDEYVGFRVIDLNDLKRTRCRQSAGHCCGGFLDLVLATPVGAFTQIDVLKASFYRSSVRWLQPCNSAVGFDVPHKLRNRWPGWLQIIRLDRRTDDLLALGI